MTANAPTFQRPILTRAEIDRVTYQCRQSGADSTYDIVEGCLRLAMEKASASFSLNPPNGFGLDRIAWELNHTALGNAFYGSALRAAMDLDFLNQDDVQLLQRFATGEQKGTDHVGLQDIANRVQARMNETASDSPRG